MPRRPALARPRGQPANTSRAHQHNRARLVTATGVGAAVITTTENIPSALAAVTRRAGSAPDAKWMVTMVEYPAGSPMSTGDQYQHGLIENGTNNLTQTPVHISEQPHCSQPAGLGSSEVPHDQDQHDEVTRHRKYQKQHKRDKEDSTKVHKRQRKNRESKKSRRRVRSSSPADDQSATHVDKTDAKLRIRQHKTVNKAPNTLDHQERLKEVRDDSPMIKLEPKEEVSLEHGQVPRHESIRHQASPELGCDDYISQLPVQQAEIREVKVSTENSGSPGLDKIPQIPARRIRSRWRGQKKRREPFRKVQRKDPNWNGMLTRDPKVPDVLPMPRHYPGNRPWQTWSLTI